MKERIDFSSLNLYIYIFPHSFNVKYPSWTEIRLMTSWPSQCRRRLYYVCCDIICMLTCLYVWAQWSLRMARPPRSGKTSPWAVWSAGWTATRSHGPTMENSSSTTRTSTSSMKTTLWRCCLSVSHWPDIQCYNTLTVLSRYVSYIIAVSLHKTCTSLSCKFQ